jgi:hypothetical protein
MLCAFRSAPLTDGKHNIGIITVTYATAKYPVAGMEK